MKRVVWAIAALGACALSCSGDAGDDDRGGAGSGGTSPMVGSGGTGSGGTGTGGSTITGSGGGTAGSGGVGSGGMGGSGGAGGSGTGGTGSGGMGTGGSGAGGSGGSGSDAGVVHKPAGPVVFTENIRLNDDTGNGTQTEVALAAGPDGLVLAGWMDERAERVCAFSFSTDGGETWSENVSIPNIDNFIGDPAVAIDGGGTMYAICQQYINPGSTGNIRMMTSSDKGKTWSSIESIQSAPDKPYAAGGVQDGVVLVSWLGNPGGIKRSTDHGKTWEAVQSLGNIIHGTAITTSTTGLVHVPYNLDSNQNQLRYLRSKDNGKTYDKPRDLIPDMGRFCFQCNPRQHPIVGAGSDSTGKFVAITWTSDMPAGEGDDDVWLMYSKDGGDTWTDPIRVNDNTSASRQFESWVAVDEYGRVHVAWTDFRDGGKNETWYARSDDPTKGFEPNVQVTDDSGSGQTNFLGDYKGIVVQGADVLVVWQDTRDDSGDIYFARAVGAAGAP